MLTNELFTLNGSGAYLPEVEEWLSGEPNHLYAIARTWFALVRDCGDDVTELLHDGCPTACIEEAAFCYVNVYKKYVSVGFYTGAFLDDTENILEGSGKRMRHVKIHPENPSENEQAIQQLIQNAYLDIKTALGKR